jgi:L-threonylcarbamoyladenylate synthase
MQAPTQILDASQEAQILRAVSLLNKGGIVALPTETVYGLAAHALLPKSVAQIFAAKQRPKNNPLIWHTHSYESARSLFNFADFSEKSKRRFNLLAENFWPGPLTIIGAKSPHISHHVDLATIAVRIPRSHVTLKILQLLDNPLVMPSANISSRPSPTCSDHVLKTLEGRIDALVDDGICTVGIESTVIRIDQEQLSILRPGAISAHMIEEILGEPVLSAYKFKLAEPESPGLAHKHYAPHVAGIRLIRADELKAYWPTSSSIIACSSHINASQKTYGLRASTALTIALPDDPELFAAHIYQALYKSEEFPLENLILVMPHEVLPDNKESPWTAVFDRLSRSAGYES